MKLSFRSLTLGLLFIGATALSIHAQEAKQWGIDKSHSSINFSIDHFFTSVQGEFHEFDGNIHFDPENLGGSSAEFTIQVASVDTDEPDRDDHLQTPDFFNAEKYPTISFKSTKFEKKSDKEFKISGKLTMRGITKDIAFNLKVKGRVDNPWQEGREIMGVEIETELDRTDFEVGTGSWAATSVVSDEVEIEIHMEIDSEK